MIKKISMIIIVLIIVLLMIFGFKYGGEEKFSTVITFSVFAIVALSYFYFEKSKMGTKEIAVIATLSAFAGVCRVPFAFIPNVQPTTFIVAISGLVFGPYEGFLIGSTATFISNIFLGQGPWTPWQMFSWGLVGAISGILGLNKKKISAQSFAIICFFYGFMFDWIMNLWHVLGFIKPLNLTTITMAYITGLTLDIMHATGNFIFTIIFFDNFYRVLMRFKKRTKTMYIKGE